MPFIIEQESEEVVTKTVKDKEKLEVFEDLTTIIKTTNQMKATQALDKICEEFHNLSHYDWENIYVIEKYGTINLIRITDIGKEYLATEVVREELTGN